MSPIPPPTPTPLFLPGTRIIDGASGVRHPLVWTEWNELDQVWYQYDYSKTYDLVIINGQVRLDNKQTLNLRACNNKQLKLSNNKSDKRTMLIHRLWLLTVVGPPPLESIDVVNGLVKWRAFTADHIDKDKNNNSPTNLRWASKSTQTFNRLDFVRTARWLPTIEPSLDVYCQFGNSGYYVSKAAEIVRFGRVGRGKKRWLIVSGLQPDKITGYVRVKIEGRLYLVHRLVAYLWPNSNDLQQLLDIHDLTINVDHLDCNTTNNHRSNLRAGTSKDNIERSLGLPVEAFNNDGTSAGVFESLTIAAASLDVCIGHISSVISGKRKRTGGYTFKLLTIK